MRAYSKSPFDNIESLRAVSYCCRNANTPQEFVRLFLEVKGVSYDVIKDVIKLTPDGNDFDLASDVLKAFSVQVPKITIDYLKLIKEWNEKSRPKVENTDILVGTREELSKLQEKKEYLERLVFTYPPEREIKITEEPLRNQGIIDILTDRKNEDRFTRADSFSDFAGLLIRIKGLLPSAIARAAKVDVREVQKIYKGNGLDCDGIILGGKVMVLFGFTDDEIGQVSERYGVDKRFLAGKDLSYGERLEIVFSNERIAKAGKYSAMENLIMVSDSSTPRLHRDIGISAVDVKRLRGMSFKGNSVGAEVPRKAAKYFKLSDYDAQTFELMVMNYDKPELWQNRHQTRPAKQYPTDHALPGNSLRR